MALILGIDAAWTEKGSSGVALLKVEKSKGRILAAEPSYAAFIDRVNRGVATRHHGRSTAPEISELLEMCAVLGRQPVDVVAIDMPMSLKKITSRRTADDAISREFGGAWAGTHSPTHDRPGAYGERIAHAFRNAGYVLATSNSSSRTAPALIEVFPLAALVRFMGLEKRPPYKVGKRRRYWPNRSPADWITLLLTEWHRIRAALAGEITDLVFEVPELDAVQSASSLKPYEDVLDAIVCAWVGWRFYIGTAEPFGDGDAAIWVPCGDDHTMQK